MSGKEINAFLDTYVDSSITFDRLLEKLPSIDFKPEKDNVALIHLHDDLTDFLLSEEHTQLFLEDLSKSFVVLPSAKVDIKINFILYKMLYHYYTYGMLRHKSSLTTNPKYPYYKLDIVTYMNQYLQNVVEGMEKEFKA